MYIEWEKIKNRLRDISSFLKIINRICKHQSNYCFSSLARLLFSSANKLSLCLDHLVHVWPLWSVYYLVCTCQLAPLFIFSTCFSKKNGHLLICSTTLGTCIITLLICNTSLSAHLFTRGTSAIISWSTNNKSIESQVPRVPSYKKKQVDLCF